jgi:hypothetical protein
MGMSGISKSQVSRLCEEIDVRVMAFLDRPIEGDWPYLWVDATYVKVRQAGRIVSVAVIVAVGVNADDRREVLGMELHPAQAAPGKLPEEAGPEGLGFGRTDGATRWPTPAGADGASSRPSSPRPSPRTMLNRHARNGDVLPISSDPSCQSSPL